MVPSPIVRDWSFISIHALHEESDSHIRSAYAGVDVFQSTLSMRRATRRHAVKQTA